MLSSELMRVQSEWGEQSEDGVDIAQLRYNLSLTDQERIEQHDRALRLFLQCREAAERAGIPILTVEADL